MILDRTVRRDIEEFFGNKQRHEGHDLKIRLERFELVPHFRFFVRLRLIHRKLGGERRFFQRIRLCARAFRRNINSDDVVTSFEQRFEYRFAERLLAMNHNTHINSSIPVILPKRAFRLHCENALDPGYAGPSGYRYYAASALAGLSGAVIAPDCLMSPTSFSE